MMNIAELPNNRLHVRPCYFDFKIGSMPFAFSKMRKFCNYDPIAKALIMTGWGDLIIIGDRAQKPLFPRRCFPAQVHRGSFFALPYAVEGVTLFDFFFQDDSGSGIYVMDLTANRTAHRLVNVTILRNIFGAKALNAVSGFGAVVRDKRHGALLRLASKTP